MTSTIQAHGDELFQDRVAQAHVALFHDDPTSLAERRDRFAEEALEVAQATGMTEEDAHKLVSYTFSRPVGEPEKEIGAAALTLASLCVVGGWDMMKCAEADLAQLQTPEKIAKVRAKRATRHGRGPLPGFSPSAPEPKQWQTYVDEHGSTVMHDGKPIDEGDAPEPIAEAVAWRYSSGWVTGPDMVKLWLITSDRALAEREATSGNVVQPLYLSPPSPKPEAVSDDEAKQWRENVEAMLSDGDPDVIRCHEGGGPEDLIGSLVLTVMRTRKRRDAALSHPKPRVSDDLTNAGAELLTLLDEWMTVSSMTANERYAAALKAFRAALSEARVNQGGTLREALEACLEAMQTGNPSENEYWAAVKKAEAALSSTEGETGV
jgi:hypothetical protein